MKLIKIEPKNKLDENECSSTAKELYEQCKKGEISAFIAVTLDKVNDTTLFIGNSEKDRKSIIHLLGAVWMLNHFCFEVIDENSD